MKSIWKSALAAVIAISLPAPSRCEAETIIIGGTGVVDELMRRASAQFTPRTGIEIEVAQNLGSPGGIRALEEGVIDLAISTQFPNEEQRARGLKVVFTRHTPFVWVTSHPFPQSMTLADIIDAYTTGKTWPDGTPIRVLLRGRHSPDTALIERLWPALGAAMEKARKKADVPVAGNDPDNADLAEHTPGSLTTMTALQVISENRNLRLITLDGVAPTLENFDRGIYKYAKPLAFIVSAHVKPATKRFLDFLRSREGEEIYRQASGY
jgi:phosphate transport system substrate-binding protein